MWKCFSNFFRAQQRCQQKLQSIRPAGIPLPVRADVHFWPLLLLFGVRLSPSPRFWDFVPCFVPESLCSALKPQNKIPIVQICSCCDPKKKPHLGQGQGSSVCCLNPLISPCVHLGPQCHQKRSQGTHPEEPNDKFRRSNTSAVRWQFVFPQDSVALCFPRD